MLQHAVLDMHQGISDHLGGEGLSLQGDPVTQVSDTQQGHEGEGDMCPDTGRGPMVYRTDFQVVFGDPKGVFHLPQAAVLIENGRIVRVRQVGDNAVQPIPALR